MRRVPTNNPLIGRTLKRIRKERELTIKQLAVATAFSNKELREIEGRGRSPSWMVVCVIANALKMSVVELAEQVQEDATDYPS
jgi:transcriptional regulator with XRE-family HTH domain